MTDNLPVILQIAESFALGASSFHIAYTDDYGEDFDIVSEADLTEAIAYFSSGNDPEDYGTSLGAPTLYSADWNQPARENANLPVFHPSSKNKIVLRVHVVVEYDGPSLSDTASFVESNTGYNGGDWDEGAYSSEGGYTEDRSAYSSGYDARSSPRRTTFVESSVQGSRGAAGGETSGYPPHEYRRSSESLPERASTTQSRETASRITSRMSKSTLHLTGSESSTSPFDDDPLARDFSRDDLSLDNGIRRMSVSSGREIYDDGHSRQGERVNHNASPYRGQDSRISLDRSLLSSNHTGTSRMPKTAGQSSLTNSELGARWIREQTERARRKLGPASSAGSSSRSSVSGEDGSDDDGTSIYSEGRGNLELVRETNGSEFLPRYLGHAAVLIRIVTEWYYSYSSTDMRLQAPPHEGQLSQRDSATSLNSSPNASLPRRDLTSLRLSTTTIDTDLRADPEDHSGELSPVETESLQTPPELSDDFEEPVGPPGLAPDCSACGTRLEYMRYVCTVCGEGHLWLEDDTSRGVVINEDRDSEESSSSASSGEQTTWAPPRKLSNSTLGLGDAHPLCIPEQESSTRGSRSAHRTRVEMAPGGPTRDGYELCPACIEVHGIKHTKAMSEMEPGELGTRRTVQRNVRKLGALNHTYKELLWGAKGWKEIGMCSFHQKGP